MVNLKEFYINNITKNLIQKYSYKNIMQVPFIKKIVISMCLKKKDKEKIPIKYALSDLKYISGQQPIITKAKKSISNFKIHKGEKIGCYVTLRKNYMYNFLEKLINIILPRIRDFRGLSLKSFDGNGNYNFGIQEQIIFPEIDYSKIDKIRGLNITIVTSSKNDKVAKSLLEEFNFPFKR